MSPTDADFPADLRALERRYELIREIGQGGMAAVYLARSRDTGHLVAIKAIRARYLDDPDAIKRFAREAQTVAGLNHSNIVRTEAIEQIDDRAIAIIMEHVPGGTVRDRLREHGSLGAEDAEAILRDVASALRYAHQRGIVHRDVKPENVFLDPSNGRAVLSDFGIARTIGGDASITLLGAALGTPQYMSPEQIDGEVVDGRSDIYSLGVLGWELLTGRRPWAGESLYGIIYKQKHEDLPRITSLRPRVPANLLFAIEGALKKNRDERFQTIDEFLDQLTYNPPPLLSQTYPPGATRAGDEPTLIFKSPSLTGQEPEQVDVVLQDDIAPAPGHPAPAFFAGDAFVESGSTPVPPVATEPVAAGQVMDLEATPEPIKRAPIAAPPVRATLAPPPSAVQPPERRRRTMRALALVLPLAIAGSTLYVALGGRGDRANDRRGKPTMTTSAGSVVGDSTTQPKRIVAVAPPAAPDTAAPTGPLIIEGEDPDSADAPLYPKPKARPAKRSVPGPKVAGSSTAPRVVSDVARPAAETVATPNAATSSDKTAAIDPVLDDPFKMPPARTAASSTPAASKGALPSGRCRIATTADQNACLTAYIAAGDGEMDGAFESLVTELRRAAGTAPGAPDPTSVSRVRVEQRAWLSIRNTECPRRPMPGAGLFWAQESSICFNEMAAARTADLRDAVRRLRNGRESAMRP
jgi:serine/threonine protein kinase/uncharacterized protein YecT (DUF1311 family)